MCTGTFFSREESFSKLMDKNNKDLCIQNLCEKGTNNLGVLDKLLEYTSTQKSDIPPVSFGKMSFTRWEENIQDLLYIYLFIV